MGKYHLTKDRLYQLDALTYYPYLGHLLIVVIATFVDSIKGSRRTQNINQLQREMHKICLPSVK